MKIDSPAPGTQLAELERDSGLSPEDRDKLKALSRQFESVLLNQMVGAMTHSVSHEDGFIPESHAEKVYRSMLDSEYAQRLADTEQIGLSHMIYEHLLRTAGGR
jgi:Rod binding domain-containing protein